MGFTLPNQGAFDRSRAEPADETQPRLSVVRRQQRNSWDAIDADMVRAGHLGRVDVARGQVIESTLQHQHPKDAA